MESPLFYGSHSVAIGRRTIVALFLAAAFAGTAFAQPEDAPKADDPFSAGSFDAAVNGPSTTSSLPASTEAVTGAESSSDILFGGSALVSTQSYFLSGFGSYAATSNLSGMLFGKATVRDYGSLYASYGISQYFLSGRSDDSLAFAAPAMNLSYPDLSLKEIYYSFDINKLAFLRIGKQLMAWGPSRVWTPVDFINSSKANFFMPIDLREGKSGLKIHLPFGSYNAFLFADFSQTVQNGIVQNLADSVSLAGRLEAAAGGYEFGLSGLASPLEQDQLGFDFSGHLLGCAAYGELAFAPAYDSYDQAWTASAGFSRALGDLKKWTLSAEGFFNSKGGDLTGNVPAMAAATPLYIGRYYGYASLGGQDFPVNNIDTTLFALANLSDLSYFASLEFDFAVSKFPKFSLLVSYYGGGENKELTLLCGSDYFSLTVRTSISF